MNNKSFIITIAIWIIALGSFSQETGIFKDSRDGKVYKTVKIGDQTWMAENLAFKSTGACWAYDDNQSNVKTYGYLYDYETANKICPKGWHLPGNEEWKQLFEYIGGNHLEEGKTGKIAVAGRKLKESGTTHWEAPNDGVDNSSGFTALPGGMKGKEGGFYMEGYIAMFSFGYWWSATDFSKNDSHGLSWCFSMSSRDNNVYLVWDNYKDNGLSVRCVKNTITNEQ
ncbi:MAG: hypothetical protein NTU98_09245 [Bacteroidetes bacterium]|nr:hypothetical protein [Bacteroidota bacterium]